MRFQPTITDAVRAAVRHDYETTHDSKVMIGRRHGISASWLGRLVRRGNWQRPAADRQGQGPVPKKRRRRRLDIRNPKARLQFVNRLFNALDGKLAMTVALLDTDKPLSAIDQERVNRDIGLIVLNLEKIEEHYAQLVKAGIVGGASASSAAAASTSATGGLDPLDQRRHELAERIRRLSAQWLADRGRAAKPEA